MMARPDWDEYFLAFLPVIGARATCDRGKSAALAVRSRQLLTTGYAGAPPGFPHCDEVGHEWVRTDGRRHCTRTVHAEQNAILQAAKLGVSLQGCTLYTTMEPCHTCAMMLVTVGCARVVALYPYAAADRVMLKEALVRLEVVNQEELY
jgi:dCMP deaminase